MHFGGLSCDLKQISKICKNHKLSLIEGVQNVICLDFNNKYDVDAGYSGNVYNLEEALRNEILYPSADPSIFEIKYPNKDIKGRAITFLGNNICFIIYTYIFW